MLGEIELLNGGRWQKIETVCDRLIMWGASDQCRVNYPILKELGCKVQALVDDTPNKISPLDGIPLFIGVECFGDYLKTIDVSGLGFVVAIGNPYGHVRLRLHDFLKELGLLPISFADPTASICKSVLYGEGLQVMPFALIHNDVVIGRECIINTRALVYHDCKLEDGVEIGPGAVLCGRVSVGEGTWIGANATVRQRINIGSNSIIGAGAVVVADIPDNVVVAGVPAKIIKENIVYE